MFEVHVLPFLQVDCANISIDELSSASYKTEKNLDYPVNVARNIARETANTYFIFPSDIELYPSPGTCENSTSSGQIRPFNVIGLKYVLAGNLNMRFTENKLGSPSINGTGETGDLELLLGFVTKHAVIGLWQQGVHLIGDQQIFNTFIRPSSSSILVTGYIWQHCPLWPSDRGLVTGSPHWIFILCVLY